MNAAPDTPAKPSEDDLLTTQEVAGILRCSPETIRRLAKEKGVARIYGKRLVRIRRGDIDKLKG